jgi:hypothetical protein
VRREYRLQRQPVPLLRRIFSRKNDLELADQFADFVGRRPNDFDENLTPSR